MNNLKNLWPTPFKIKKVSLGSFLIQLIIFIVICAVVGWLFSVLGGIPILGVIFWILGILLWIYSIVGIVLCILCFLGIT